MMRLLIARFVFLAFAGATSLCQAQQNRETNRAPVDVLSSSLRKVLDMVAPPENTPAKTFYLTLEIRKAEGVPKFFNDLSAKVALQMPDRAWASADVGDKS